MIEFGLTQFHEQVRGDDVLERYLYPLDWTSKDYNRSWAYNVLYTLRPTFMSNVLHFAYDARAGDEARADMAESVNVSEHMLQVLRAYPTKAGELPVVSLVNLIFLAVGGRYKKLNPCFRAKKIKKQTRRVPVARKWAFSLQDYELDQATGTESKKKSGMSAKEASGHIEAGDKQMN